jgi:hypothetical protein
MKPIQLCSICQRPFEECSNSAWPVSNGICCVRCDWLVVIPARLVLIAAEEKNQRTHETDLTKGGR